MIGTSSIGFRLGNITAIQKIGRIVPKLERPDVQGEADSGSKGSRAVGFP